jgi:UDP-N-acetylmuramate--alanine ligase
VRVECIEPCEGGVRFEVAFPDGKRVSTAVAVPGEHMALNAAAVLAALWALGLDPDAAARGIEAFGGVKRRFERVGEIAGVTVVDDYAHHPTEVRATLRGARGAGFGRVWVVFQPHRYTRTAALSDEFGASFADADRLVLMDVYSAGEAPVPGVSGKTVLDAVLHSAPRTRAAYFPHRADVAGYVAERVRPGDLVMTMGAGDVTTMGAEIVRALRERGQTDDVAATSGGASCL